MSNSGKLARLVVAAQGWQHVGWGEGFYPDDLPVEWQLGYYANEFRAVLVEPPSSAEQVEAWLDDVDEEFGFCLDLRQAPAAGPVLAAFKQQLLGIMVADQPGILPGSVAVFSEAQETAVSLPNSPQSQVFDNIQGDGMRLCLYRAAADLTLAGLREDMETLLQAVPTDGCCIMAWCDEPPPIEIMRQAIMIAEFLGA